MCLPVLCTCECVGMRVGVGVGGCVWVHARVCVLNSIRLRDLKDQRLRFS